MNIKSSTFTRTSRPATIDSLPKATSSPKEPQPTDGFKPSNNLSGTLGRAVYGAGLYGLPAIAGATMGINGVVPGVFVGAGLGAITHLDNASSAAVFGATGAVVGGAAAYLGFLAAGTEFALPVVAIAAGVGAGTQALFSLIHEK